jgi:hypothetical protein
VVHNLDVVPIDPSADTGECNAFQFSHLCEIQASVIAARQQFRGRMHIGEIDWTYCVDNLFTKSDRGQVKWKPAKRRGVDTL